MTPRTGQRCGVSAANAVTLSTSRQVHGADTPASAASDAGRRTETRPGDDTPDLDLAQADQLKAWSRDLVGYSKVLFGAHDALDRLIAVHAAREDYEQREAILRVRRHLQHTAGARAGSARR
jgi:hypothetical protein